MTATLTEAPAPGTPEWAALITASKVAGILGLSPWESPRSIYHLLRGEVPADDGRNAKEKSRGHYLENGVLDWWCDQHPEYLFTRRQHVAVRDDLPWALATPDLAAWPSRIFPDDAAPAAIVDAKTAREDDEWGKPGTDEIPPYYAAQLTWGMHLSGARVAYVALLTTRLDLREYVLHYDAETAHTLEWIAAMFYMAAINGEAPPLDDHAATLQTMRRVHPDVDRDLSVQLDEDAARALVDTKAAREQAEAAERYAKSTVLDLMGQARTATYGGTTVARRQGTGRGGVALRVLADALPAAE